MSIYSQLRHLRAPIVFFCLLGLSTLRAQRVQSFAFTTKVDKLMPTDMRKIFYVGERAWAWIKVSDYPPGDTLDRGVVRRRSHHLHAKTPHSFSLHADFLLQKPPSARDLFYYHSHASRSSTLCGFDFGEGGGVNKWIHSKTKGIGIVLTTSFLFIFPNSNIFYIHSFEYSPKICIIVMSMHQECPILIPFCQD